MTVVVENIKKYLSLIDENSRLLNINLENVTEVPRDVDDSGFEGLYPERVIKQSIKYLKDERQLISKYSRQNIKKNYVQYLKTVEMMMLFAEIHGEISFKFTLLKDYQSIAKNGESLLERNYGRCLESIFHFINENNEFLPDRGLKLLPEVKSTFHSSGRKIDAKSFIVEMTLIIYSSSLDSIDPVLIQLTDLRKSSYKSFFDKSSIESALVRAQLEYLICVLKVKAAKFGGYHSKTNEIETGYVMKKLAMKVLMYFQKKSTDLNVFNGNYETVLYVWGAVKFFLMGLHLISESFTLMGIDRDARVAQNEYFRYARQYCIPYRIKLVLRLMMHTDFVCMRISSLQQRDSQLEHVKTVESICPIISLTKFTKLKQNDEDVDDLLIGDFREHCNLREKKEASKTSNNAGGEESQDDQDSLPDLDTAHNNWSPIMQKAMNSNKKKLSYPLTISTYNESNKPIHLESCYIQYSPWKRDLVHLLKSIEYYIWQVHSNEHNIANLEIAKKYRDDNRWQQVFLQSHSEDNCGLIDEDNKENILQLNREMSQCFVATTPKNTSPKNSSVLPPIIRKNAQHQNNQYFPQLPRRRKQNNQITNEINCKEDEDPIESVSTLVIPFISRNIKYEAPESKSNECLFQVRQINEDSSLSLIDYLSDVVKRYNLFQIPCLHRPVYQRLAMHYFHLQEQSKSAITEQQLNLDSYYLALSVNIAFTQNYHYKIIWKINSNPDHSRRWSGVNDNLIKCLSSASHFYDTLERVLPQNWSILQLTLIDELPITPIKSSQLSAVIGGCMGARNVAVLLVTKFVKRDKDLVAQTRILHGFKQTGLQLLDELEQIKADSFSGLDITVREEWWKKRYSIDESMQKLINQMRTDWMSNDDIDWMMDVEYKLQNQPKILVLDRNLARVPWESILQSSAQPYCITRMPNVLTTIGHLTQMQHRDPYHKTHNAFPTPTTDIPEVLTKNHLIFEPTKAYYIVNPDNSLPQTEQSLLPLFHTNYQWKGLSGLNINQLDSRDVFQTNDFIIYCGHGTGSRYLLSKSLSLYTSNSAVFLIGCQSARISNEASGRTESHAPLYDYLYNGCSMIFGLLWDVTDREIDKFTMALFNHWIHTDNSVHAAQLTMKGDTYNPRGPLPCFVHCNEVVQSVKLKTATAKSPVIYGVPIWIPPNQN